MIMENENVYVVYGKENCPFCEQAKALLTTKGMKFDYLTLDVDYDRDDLFALAPNARTVPQIWLVQENQDNEANWEETWTHIGGFQELKATFEKSEIEQALDEGATVSVVFTKADGTERTMLCTKNSEVISEQYTAPEKKSTRERKDISGVVAVFDLEKNDWRSFRLDSVKSYMVFEEAE